MRFTSFFSLATLVAVAVADYDLWYRSCGSGLAKLDVIAANDRQGPCSSKACDVAGESLGVGDARGGNPCNGKCKDDLIYRYRGNKNYDIIVAGTGIKVGDCRAVNNPTLAACRSTAKGDCTMIEAYRCYTHYCNEPAKAVLLEREFEA